MSIPDRTWLLRESLISETVPGSFRGLESHFVFYREISWFMLLNASLAYVKMTTHGIFLSTSVPNSNGCPASAPRGYEQHPCFVVWSGFLRMHPCTSLSVKIACSNAGDSTLPCTPLPLSTTPQGCKYVPFSVISASTSCPTANLGPETVSNVSLHSHLVLLRR